MNRSLSAISSSLVCALVASTALLAGSTSPAAAGQAPWPSADDKLLSVEQVARVFPAYADGKRTTSTKYGLFAPSPRSKCDGRRTFQAPLQGSSYYIETGAHQKGPLLDQDVLV